MRHFVLALHVLAGAGCLILTCLRAQAENREWSAMRAHAIELVKVGEPDALATAAMLYDSVNAHAEALTVARRAGRLAPDRADLAWLELRVCAQEATCVLDAPARRLLALDPGNGAALLHELDPRRKKSQPDIELVLARIAQAERIDSYWNRLVIAATDTLSRFPLQLDADERVAEAFNSSLLHAVGMVSSVALPDMSLLASACNREDTEDSTRRDLCLRIARVLQRSDTALAEGLGIGLEERLWPDGSAEAAAARARRAELRAQQSEVEKYVNDPEWLPRALAAMRTQRTEREVRDTVLAQYRASGHTAARRSDSIAGAVPLSSDAALGSATAITSSNTPGRTRMPIEFLNVNFLAVLVAALSSFLLGGLWYSRALFGATWSREAGVSTEKQGHRPMVFAISYVLAFLAAWVFAALLPTEISTAQATLLGALIGLAWVATSFGINYGFGDRSLTLWLIDAGYHTLQFTLFGAILGAWR